MDLEETLSSIWFSGMSCSFYGSQKEEDKLSVFSDIREKKSYLALVGLGYVGMPIAVAFSEQVPTIGFDINEEKIGKYREGKDPTNEVGDEKIKNCSVEFTSDEERLKEASFIIVAVPTPVKPDHTPDLSPVEGGRFPKPLADYPE